MVWYETLTCRYFYAEKEEVEKFVKPEKALGEVLDFLENHDLRTGYYLATLDSTIKVSIRIVDNKLIMAI